MISWVGTTELHYSTKKLEHSLNILKGVIHLVRTHEGGEGGQANAYECVQGGKGG